MSLAAIAYQVLHKTYGEDAVQDFCTRIPRSINSTFSVFATTDRSLIIVTAVLSNAYCNFLQIPHRTALLKKTFYRTVRQLRHRKKVILTLI